MKTRTEQILVVLKIIAWIAMIGFAVEAGSKIISFVVSLYNPEGAKNLYKGLDYYELRQYNKWIYAGVMTLTIAVTMLKVEVWYRVIKLFSDLNLQTPFKLSVVLVIEQISYSLLTIWIMGLVGNGYVDWVIKHHGFDISKFSDTDEYLFMASLVYIISQIFKRGVELQEENELTV